MLYIYFCIWLFLRHIYNVLPFHTDIQIEMNSEHEQKDADTLLRTPISSVSLRL
jgi:hypothetical protein